MSAFQPLHSMISVGKNVAGEIVFLLYTLDKIASNINTNIHVRTHNDYEL